LYGDKLHDFNDVRKLRTVPDGAAATSRGGMILSAIRSGG
jgi:hypothetical protein